MDKSEEVIASPTGDNDSDDDDDSEGKLEIVIKTPKKKPLLEPTERERKIIESIEDDLQRKLEEKAAKRKLNVVNVKNIIKQVVTNEHVMALIRKAENPADCSDETVSVFEPKLTRAKAKELFSSSQIPPVPWITAKCLPAQTQILVKKAESLAVAEDNIKVEEKHCDEDEEEEVEDETMPDEDGSEDDLDSSIISDNLSVPSTPSNTTAPVQTIWSDDGVFKVPQVKEEIDDEESIVTTKSRIQETENMDTSSDLIEEKKQTDQETDVEEVAAPTDRTETDLEDNMDYDNEEWLDFLKTFALPLDEIAKATEDDEQDPEYNILADEEIDKIDKEELRVDKAVKVSRKELNNLIAELLECFDWGEERIETTNQPEIVIITITEQQLMILEQQMRQHVQMLAQNFILTYQHPEFHVYSEQLREFLLNLKYLCAGKQKSAFHTVNLDNALTLVNNWALLLESNSDDVKNMKMHVEKTIDESWQCKYKGTQYIPTFPALILETISKSDVFLYTSLLPKIPLKSSKLFSRNQVSYTNSEDNLIALGLEQFSPIVAQMSDKKMSLNRKNEPQIKRVCSFIQEFMLQFKDARKIYTHVKQSKSSKCGENPIKYYFRYQKAPCIVHFITPLNQLQVLPPCKRQPNDLPAQWRDFIYNKVESTPLTLITNFLSSTIPTVYLQSPSNTQFVSVINHQRPILPKPLSANTVRLGKRKRFRRSSLIDDQNRHFHNICSNTATTTIKTTNCDPITKFVKILSQPSSLSKLLNLYTENNGEASKLKSLSKTAVQRLHKTNYSLNPTKGYLDNFNNMLPSMPHLTTPVKRISPETSTPIQGIKVADTAPLDFSVIGSGSQQQKVCDSEVDGKCSNDTTLIVATNNDKDNEETIKTLSTENDVKKESNVTDEKDNPEDIQNLVLASSTTKHTIRKELSGAEKKKLKIKKEFMANLSIATPEDPETEMRKSEIFAFKYYDKMRETMGLEDYHKMIQILNDHEGDAVELYNKISPILRPKYEELAEEFLLFLREKEARAVNQLVPWIQINNRSTFLRKLEIYFKDQPAQLKKIYKCLTELSQSMDVSMEKIKNTLLPMFKGNTILSDLFLQNFLSEKPPASLLEGPFETIDINKELIFAKDDDLTSSSPYEMVTIPDVEDKFGGQTCICACHQIEDPEFKTKFRHCIRCGTKFVNGKVFIQTGKVLRPANFSFLTNPETDHSIRLTGKPSTTSNLKRRCDASPSKQPSGLLLSPTKDNCDEESDYYEGDRKKKTKRKARNKYKKQADKADDNLKDSCNENNVKKDTSPKNDSRKPTINKKRCTIKKTLQKRRKSQEIEIDDDSNIKVECFKPGAMKGQKKRLMFATDENMMSDMEDNNSSLMVEEAGDGGSCSAAGGVGGDSLSSPLFDIKVNNSPGQNTAESESEFCEESSQDNCESDSNSSIASDNTQSQSDCNTDGGGDGSAAAGGGSWKREEDKIILEAFQKENDKEDAFKLIASQLKNRSISQIRRRFDTLIKLLMDTVGKRKF